MNFYIYKHIRLDTNEVFYIGKGSGNRAYRKYGRNTYWQNIVAKYGYIVEFLEENLTENEAFEKERKLIEHYKAENLCKANFCEGGEGASGYKWTEEQKTTQRLKRVGRKLSQEHCEAIADSHKGVKNHFFGKVHKEDSKKLIGENNKKHTQRGDNPSARSVEHIESGKLYKCMKDAAEAYNIGWLKVSRHCRKVTKKQEFRYLGEYNGRS